jgi:hypothetical protein
VAELTEAEKATNAETLKHIHTVRNFLHIIAVELIDRGRKHDETKLEDPELAGFVEYTPKLAACTYGSDEYSEYLAGLKPCLDHHYAKNRHHPEHFKNGIDDMTIIDLIEMFCDWKAATLRHNDGNIKQSIEINSKRFNIDHQLAKILMNSIHLFD